MMTYKDFLECGLDIAPLGVDMHFSNAPYFCTPRDATIFGWSGVDGIHFCFVPGFGDMVFAVSPTNAPGKFVHPIASCFSDFLRLLLACGDAAALEQAWQWDKTQFDEFLCKNTPDEQQYAALKGLAEVTGLSAMDNPFKYIHELQSGFDYSLIEYKKIITYTDNSVQSEWQVRYSCGLFGTNTHEKPGTEIAVNRNFTWCDDEYCVPAVYSCAKGLVVDILKRVSEERVHAFVDKYYLSEDSDDGDFDDETLRIIEQDNPLNVRFSPSVVINGHRTMYKNGSSACWHSLMPDNNEDEMRNAVAHYNLDPKCSWVLSRWTFPWHEKCEIQSLSLTLNADNTMFSGPRLDGAMPGFTVEMTHPTTGIQHTLTILSMENKTYDLHRDIPGSLNYPTLYTFMTYTVVPDLTQDEFTVYDISESEHSQPIDVQASSSEACCDANVGIIGGSDGPTAILISSDKAMTNEHTAYSKLRFDETDNAQWRTMFRVKTLNDIDVKLI